MQLHYGFLRVIGRVRTGETELSETDLAVLAGDRTGRRPINSYPVYNVDYLAYVVNTRQIVRCSGDDGIERRGSDALELFLYFLLQVWLVTATSLHHVGVLLLNTYLVTFPTFFYFLYIWAQLRRARTS